MKAYRWLVAPAEFRWPRIVMIVLWASLISHSIDSLIGLFR